jgi:hypothetical protein
MLFQIIPIVITNKQRNKVPNETNETNEMANIDNDYEEEVELDTNCCACNGNISNDIMVVCENGIEQDYEDFDGKVAPKELPRWYLDTKDNSCFCAICWDEHKKLKNPKLRPNDEKFLDEWHEVVSRKGCMYNLGFNIMLKVKYRNWLVVDWEYYNFDQKTTPVIDSTIAKSKLGIGNDMMWVRQIDNDNGKTYIKLVKYSTYVLDTEQDEAYLQDYEYDWDSWEKRRESERIKCETYTDRVNAILAEFM